MYLSALHISMYYGSMGCRVFQRGIQNWKDFRLKINIPKGNDWILRIGVVASCQKLGIILENKVIKKLMLSKMSITKNVLLNWYSSMKKKLRKIRMIFDIENWLWKSNFGTFWQLAINPKLKIQSFPLGMLILSQKSF